MELSDLDKLLGVPIPDVVNNTIIEQEAPKEFKEIISENHKNTVTELHAHYLMHGEYQTLSRLKQSLPDLDLLTPTGLRELIDQVNVTLEKRDLPKFKTRLVTLKTKYDPAFITACHVMADVSDRRPVGSKLRSINMTTTRWNNFLKVKANRDYWNAIVDSLMVNEVWNEGRIALARNVADGDLPSIKYTNELTGKFVQQRDFDPRILQVLLTSILDIIVRHVDPNTARVIADEIEGAAIRSMSGVLPTTERGQLVHNPRSEPILDV